MKSLSRMKNNRRYSSCLKSFRLIVICVILPLWIRSVSSTSSNVAFRTDVIDTGDAYKLEAELPGFNKEDIQLNVENDCLTVTAEHKSEKKEEDEKKNFIKRERFYGSYTRSFDVSGINVDGIEATYENGVLTLNLPKKAAEIPASRKLEIK